MDNFLQDTNSLTFPSLSLPEIDITPISVRNYKLADYSYELIREYIKEFEDSLDNEHEVGVKLTSFGQSITMSVTDIGYANPTTLIFYGLVNGNQATLIQHMSQLNFLLIAVPKADPEQPPRRIGFAISDDKESE